jgi:hypothetical protein
VVVTEKIESGGGRVRHPLLADAVRCDGDGHGGHNRSLSVLLYWAGLLGWSTGHLSAGHEAPGKPRPQEP